MDNNEERRMFRFAAVCLFLLPIGTDRGKYTTRIHKYLVSLVNSGEQVKPVDTFTRISPILFFHLRSFGPRFVPVFFPPFFSFFLAGEQFYAPAAVFAHVDNTYSAVSCSEVDGRGNVSAGNLGKAKGGFASLGQTFSKKYTCMYIYTYIYKYV